MTLDKDKKYSLRIDGGDELHYSDADHIIDWLKNKYGVKGDQIRFEEKDGQILVGIYAKFDILMRYVGFVWENS